MKNKCLFVLLVLFTLSSCNKSNNVSSSSSDDITTSNTSSSSNLSSESSVSSESIISSESSESGSSSESSSSIDVPQTSHDRQLVWHDEFSGDSLDETKWSYEIGTGDWGWGNNEQQYYRKENVRVSDGTLKIDAKKESYQNSNYTSARIITKDKFEFHYGYVEAKLKLPSISGIWPAFWMLGANISEVSWPTCGEIDIMEAINTENKVYSTIHWQSNDGQAFYPGTNESYFILNDRQEYHTYGMLWTNEKLEFYVDKTLSVSAKIMTNNNTDPIFTRDFYFLFNVAVGGNWPGFNIDPNFTTQTMEVDYLRVYQ